MQVEIQGQRLPSSLSSRGILQHWLGVGENNYKSVAHWLAYRCILVIAAFKTFIKFTWSMMLYKRLVSFTWWCWQAYFTCNGSHGRLAAPWGLSSPPCSLVRISIACLGGFAEATFIKRSLVLADVRKKWSVLFRNRMCFDFNFQFKAIKYVLHHAVFVSHSSVICKIECRIELQCVVYCGWSLDYHGVIISIDNISEKVVCPTSCSFAIMWFVFNSKLVRKTGKLLVLVFSHHVIQFAKCTSAL